MKKFLYNFRKNYKVNIAKTVLIILFVVTFLLLYFNRGALLFQVNGFEEVAHSPLQVYYLDVGQATSTFVVLPNKTTMLIDAGEDDSAEKLVSDVNWILEENKIDAIDFLVLTHSDADHVGGADEILENFEVKSALRPKILASEETKLLTQYDYNIVETESYNLAMKTLYAEPNCDISFVEDLSMKVGKDLNIRIFACQKDRYSQTNAYSPFIVLDYKGNSFMFTGDATASREKELLDVLESENSTLEIDFLLVAHHGSKYSTTEEFLEATKPKYAFISAGDNTHPTKEVLSRLEAVGVKDIFVTKEDGNLAVGVKSDGLFFIKKTSLYVDVPCIAVVLGVLLCVMLFVTDMYNRNKKKRNKDK